MGCSFFFQAEDGIRDESVTGVQTCALPIHTSELQSHSHLVCRLLEFRRVDRKSTRLNSSHTLISYAVFCLKKKTKTVAACPTRRGRGRPPPNRGADARPPRVAPPASVASPPAAICRQSPACAERGGATLGRVRPEAHRVTPARLA